MELYGIRQKKRQTMPLAGIFMAITAVGVYRSFCDEFSYPANYREVYLGNLHLLVDIYIDGDVKINSQKYIICRIYDCLFWFYAIKA